MFQAYLYRIAVAPICRSINDYGLIPLTAVTYITVVTLPYLYVKCIVIELFVSRNFRQGRSNTLMYNEGYLIIKQIPLVVFPNDVQGRDKRIARSFFSRSPRLIFRQCIYGLQHYVISCLMSCGHSDSCCVCSNCSGIESMRISIISVCDAGSSHGHIKLIPGIIPPIPKADNRRLIDSSGDGVAFVVAVYLTVVV